MSFIGNALHGKSLPERLDWSKTHIVLVTGDFPNTCGHILLYVGGGFGHYFHFTGPRIYDYPRYLNGDGEYRRFLKDSGKDELARKYLTIPSPEKAEARLSQLMQNRWLTRVVMHNCATFAMEVVHAGGNFWTFPAECPVLGMGAVMWIERLFGKQEVAAAGVTR